MKNVKKEQIPALQDCPHVIAFLTNAIMELSKEVSILQSKVLELEVKNGKR